MREEKIHFLVVNLAFCQDMAVFMDQWVRMGGHAKFFMKFVFNRKRNTVELQINQDAANNKEVGVRKYVGPVLVALQELDGQFRHSFQVRSGCCCISLLYILYCKYYFCTVVK
jgi:hypothetical protein